jgi:uncharacterized protein YkwD
MKKRYVILFVLILAAGCSQRIKPGKQPSGNAFIEKAVIEEMNFAREHPRDYIAVLRELRAKYDGMYIMRPEINARIRTKEGVRAVDEAIRYLQSVSPVHPLTSSKGMSKGATDHAMDQGATGAFGHEGRDGSFAGERVNRYGEWQGSVGENIAYGHGSAREIVAGLIVDDGVADRSHRTNIFDPDFFIAGVAFGHHPKYRTICVITFANRYIEKNENP